MVKDDKSMWGFSPKMRKPPSQGLNLHWLENILRRIRPNDERFQRAVSEALIQITFGAISSFCAIIQWVIYYVLLLLKAHANMAYTVSFVLATIMVFVLKSKSSEWGGRRKLAKRFVKFVIVYLTSGLVGNAITYFVAGAPWLDLHDGWAIWFTYPFTFAINSLGSRFFVFKDADDKRAKHSEKDNQTE